MGRERGRIVGFSGSVDSERQVTHFKVTVLAWVMGSDESIGVLWI